MNYCIGKEKRFQIHGNLVGQQEALIYASSDTSPFSAIHRRHPCVSRRQTNHCVTKVCVRVCVRVYAIPQNQLECVGTGHSGYFGLEIKFHGGGVVPCL